MLKRTLFFSTPMQLSLSNGQLVYRIREAPDEKQTIPIEDIGYVILENNMISVTLPLLNALTENNASVIICNDRLMPSAMLMSLESNHIQGEMFRNQITASVPLRKSLWQQCIIAKIFNQGALLHRIGADGNILKPLYKNVKSGDSNNREGVAAKTYWKQLFGNDFIREREGTPPNNLLNYGYSILRAATARALIGSSLLPSFGIFHRNRYNAFPLADDIMEPYRPYIDYAVYELYFSGETELNKNTKSTLLQVLYADTLFDKVRRPLDVGLSMTTASLAKCFSGKEKKLSIPTFN